VLLQLLLVKPLVILLHLPLCLLSLGIAQLSKNFFLGVNQVHFKALQLYRNLLLLLLHLLIAQVMLLSHDILE
jgi:hypothetical protein